MIITTGGHAHLVRTEQGHFRLTSLSVTSALDLICSDIIQCFNSKPIQSTQDLYLDQTIIYPIKCIVTNALLTVTCSAVYCITDVYMTIYLTVRVNTHYSFLSLTSITLTWAIVYFLLVYSAESTIKPCCIGHLWAIISNIWGTI